MALLHYSAQGHAAKRVPGDRYRDFQMIRLLAPILGLILFIAAPAGATERVKLGQNIMWTNDFFADGRDRWRSGSITAGLAFGPEWGGSLPTQPGEILELRLLLETMSPANITTPAAGDRPFAGHLSVGVHSHFQQKGYEVALGADLSMIGPQTRLDRAQSDLHRMLGMDEVSALTRAGQIGNRVQAGMVFEFGREVEFVGKARLRPFVEARAGVETLVRGGFDLTVGPAGLGELLARDPVTGHRSRIIDNGGVGASFVLGADLAHVASSVFLPESRGLTLTDSRSRLRAGVHWQGEKTDLFYGLTWMGREFTGQEDGQLVGSLRLRMNF